MVNLKQLLYALGKEDQMYYRKTFTMHSKIKLFSPMEREFLKWFIPILLIVNWLLFSYIEKAQSNIIDKSDSLITVKVVHTGSIAEPNL